MPHRSSTIEPRSSDVRCARPVQRRRLLRWLDILLSKVCSSSTTSADGLSCSPACATCTGPSADHCLACTPPRANLNGQCVGYDATTGICDSSLSVLQGVFIVNNGKRECDCEHLPIVKCFKAEIDPACPVGCATCSIPSFSSSSSFTDQTCQSCQDGYLLQGGSCVRSCTEGWFLASPAERNGTCTSESNGWTTDQSANPNPPRMRCELCRLRWIGRSLHEMPTTYVRPRRYLSIHLSDLIDRS